MYLIDMLYDNKIVQSLRTLSMQAMEGVPARGVKSEL